MARKERLAAARPSYGQWPCQRLTCAGEHTVIFTVGEHKGAEGGVGVRPIVLGSTRLFRVPRQFTDGKHDGVFARAHKLAFGMAAVRMKDVLLPGALLPRILATRTPFSLTTILL